MREETKILSMQYTPQAQMSQGLYIVIMMSRQGIKQEEIAIDVSVDTVADIEDYALNQTSGNISNNSYEVDVRAIDDFGTKYNLGDYITVKDSVTGQTWTAKIEEATKTVSAADKKLSLVIGEQEQNCLIKYKIRQKHRQRVKAQEPPVRHITLRQPL